MRQAFLDTIADRPQEPGPRLVYADWLEEQGESKTAEQQRITAGLMATRWHFMGDVNLEYGGAFIDMENWDNGYCEAVRVTDLDSGCGFTGAVLIEHVVINLPNSAQEIRRCLSYCGPENFRGMNKIGSRFSIAYAAMEYGHVDPDDSWDNYRSHHTEIVQLDPDGPMVFDGWRADKRLKGTTLEAYVNSVHLR